MPLARPSRFSPILFTSRFVGVGAAAVPADLKTGGHRLVAGRADPFGPGVLGWRLVRRGEGVQRIEVFDALFSLREKGVIVPVQTNIPYEFGNNTSS